MNFSYGSASAKVQSLHNQDLPSEAEEGFQSAYQSYSPSDSSDHQEKVTDRKRIFRNSLVTIITISLIVLSVVAISTKSSGLKVNNKDLLSSTVSSTNPTSVLTVTASNEYGVFTGPYSWLEDVAGSQLVEPYKETTLSLSGSIVDSGLYTFTWKIDDYGHELLNEDSKISRKIILSAAKNYQITIKAYAIDLVGADTDYFAYSYSTLLICK